MAEADLSALRDAVVRVGAELTGTDLVGVVADEHRRQWFCRPRGWMWKEVLRHGSILGRLRMCWVPSALEI